MAVRAEMAGPLGDAERILTGLASAFLANTGRYREAPDATPGPTDVELSYQTLLEQIPAVVFMGRLDDGISQAYVSPHIEKVLGFSREEWLDDPIRWYHQIHPEDRERWSLEAASFVLSGQPLRSVYRVLARDGRTVWFQCEVKMVRHDDGRPWFLHGAGIDVTDLKNAELALKRARDDLQEREAALERSEAYLAEAQRLSHAGSFGWRVASGELWWSEESFRIFGYDSGIKPSIDLVLRRVHPEDKAMVGQTLERAQRDRKDFQLELKLLMPDGSIKFLRVAAHAWEKGEPQEAEFVGSVMDITPTKQAEQEIQALSERLLAAQEEERRRIARELHDGLNQEIAAVTLALGRIRPKLKDREPEAAEQLEKVKQHLLNLSSSVRDLSHQLHPAILEYSDLPTALAAASAEFSSASGVKVSFRASGRFEDVPHAVALCVYRITQEALQNVAKHAAAKEASAALERTQDGLSLTVSDRGVGFHPSQARASGGLGLVSMRERVRLVRGVLHVESEPDRGTTLRVEIPLTDVRPRSNQV
jgi:PAS domain S-box-containing protein